MFLKRRLGVKQGDGDRTVESGSLAVTEGVAIAVTLYLTSLSGCVKVAPMNISSEVRIVNARPPKPASARSSGSITVRLSIRYTLASTLRMEATQRA